MKALKGFNIGFHSGASYLVKVLAIAAAYFITAKIGLSLDAVSGFATLVWPPTGISLAALLILGRKFWPGVLIGAFFANLFTGAPLPVAAGIGVGNTLEAVIGAYLITRYVKGFRISLDRLSYVLGIIIFGALLSTIVSATIGVTTLMLGGALSAGYFDTLRAWWVGDMLADLVIAPFIMVWASGKPNLRITAKSAIEIAGIFLSILVVHFLLFGKFFISVTNPVSYLIFIPLIWASIRFGIRGGITTMFAINLLTIWGTITGSGPFMGVRLSDSLLLLQLFIGTVSVVILLLSSTVTQHRKAEVEISGLNKKLIKSVKDLRKLDKLKTEFLNIAAHELKTPLIPIIGYAEMLLKNKKTPRDVDEKLEIVLRSARREQKLVDDVLNLSRLEAGTMKFDMTDIQPVDMLNKCINEILPRAKAKNIKLEVTMPEKLPVIYGDEWRLAQATENLLNNAVKFTEKGKITVTARRHGNYVIVSIKDTGIGVSRENTRKLFTKFFQADTGPARRHEGTGIGLIIVRKIIEVHKGKIWAKSRQGRGSEFIFKLPAKV